MNNELDDLDELERELGDTVRAALRKVAKTVADDQRPMGSGHGSSAGEVFLTVDAENTTKSRPPRNGMHLIAAGILAAASVAGIALAVTKRWPRPKRRPCNSPSTCSPISIRWR